MELAALAARINSGRQAGEQIRIEATPVKGATAKKPEKVASATSRFRSHRHRHTAPTEAPKAVAPESVTK